jgi:hypothetical protein
MYSNVVVCESYDLCVRRFDAAVPSCRDAWLPLADDAHSWPESQRFEDVESEGRFRSIVDHYDLEAGIVEFAKGLHASLELVGAF